MFPCTGVTRIPFGSTTGMLGRNGGMPLETVSGAVGCGAALFGPWGPANAGPDWSAPQGIMAFGGACASRCGGTESPRPTARPSADRPVLSSVGADIQTASIDDHDAARPVALWDLQNLT